MVRLSLAIVVVLLLLGGAGAAYIKSGAYDVAATAEEHALTARLLRAVRHNSVERRGRRIDPRLPTSLSTGELHAAVAAYEDMCAICHAPPGAEPTPLARGLNPEPPDLARVADEHTPETLFWVVKNGIRMTGMPAWGVTHSDDELWQLVALIRLFPRMDAGDYEESRAAADDDGSGHDHEH